MVDVSNKEGSNVSGLQKIEYAPIEWVDSFPDVILVDDAFTVRDSVTFNIGKDWLTADVESGSANYTEKQAEPKLTAAIVARTAHSNKELVALLNVMGTFNYIARVQDRNGHYRLVGTLDFPLTFKAEFKTGTNINDEKGFKYSFTAELLESAPFYTI